MEQLWNRTEEDLYTVFTPVLYSKAENLSNIWFWLQIPSEFLLKIREKNKILKNFFLENKIFWLLFIEAHSNKIIHFFLNYIIISDC